MLVIRVGKYRYSLQCSHYDSISSTAKEQTPGSIISYLYLSKGTPTSRIILDDTQPQFDHTQFVEADWTSFYPDAAESILPNAPELKVKSILVLCFVDGDHSGNQVKHWLHWHHYLLSKSTYTLVHKMPKCCGNLHFWF